MKETTLKTEILTLTQLIQNRKKTHTLVDRRKGKALDVLDNTARTIFLYVYFT